MSEVYVLRSARFLAADVWKQAVRPGDTVVDATMGNGHDTCLLAGLVGAEGHVYAFDVQQQALEMTGARLRDAHLESRVDLICDGHEHMAEYVHTPVRVVAFNLGWLPGGDKTVTTRWSTTFEAVSAALLLLSPMGVCTVCVYPGHAAGEEERTFLTEYLAKLPPQGYNVLRQSFINAGSGAPECFVIQRQETPLRREEK
ncbi:MAG: hypothetical protein MR021_07110 [Clostridiales bacterium]|nr:hypothetical protein [Clostridiales bacterium]